MTDPQWLMKKFDLKFKTPSLDNLKVESESFSCAIPQVDCTRPFAHSILFGLLPSQHKQGSYKYDLDSYNNQSIAEILKEKISIQLQVYLILITLTLILVYQEVLILIIVLNVLNKVMHLTLLGF